MPNNFANTSWVSMEILRILQNTLEVADIFNSDWESEFGRTFPVDSSVQIKLPQRFLVTDGLGYQPQGFNRLTTTVNLDQIFGIHFEWDSYERLVRMERSEDELRKNYLEPAARQLAQEIDSRAADWARINTNNVFGALATDSTNINPFSSAERRLFEKACPAGERKLCLSGSAMEIYLRNVLPTQFNPVDELRKAYKTGLLAMAFGCEWYRSNSLQQHTIGTWASTVTIVGAGQSGSSLIIIGTAADTIKKGDKFTIAAVNQVNPSTRRAAGAAALMQFTALQDYTLTGGNDTISISPAIYGPGSQYQNVDALPANAAALTLWPGTSSPNGKVGTVNLLLSKWAFAIAGGKMEVPKAVEKGEQTIDPDSGLAIRFVRAWDQRESKMTNRFDGVVGFGNLYPDNGAVAIAGA